MFELINVTKKYNNDMIALNDVSLKINRGSLTAIVGKSGSGKSTLLNVMSTLDKVTSGIIRYNTFRLDQLSEKTKASFRLTEFGFIFQKYYLMPTLNIYDNIVLPLALLGKEFDKEIYEKIIGVLDIRSQLHKMPSQLSGGQQQRVAIARAMIHNPNVVFADEPTGNLDSENSRVVMELLFSCAKLFNQTLIYVTHDMNLAKLADRVLTLKDGVLVEDKNFTQ